MPFFEQVYYSNSITKWLCAFVLAILTYLVLLIIKKLGVYRLKKISALTRTDIDDFLVGLLDHTRHYFLIAISLLVALTSLRLPEGVKHIAYSVLIILLLIQVWYWGNEGLNFLIAKLIGRDKSLATSREAIQGTMPALRFLGQVILFSTILMVALDNFGFNVTTLLASLGVGGIAIALSLQTILGDLFASLSIVLDKPFHVGDFVVIENLNGTVEKIGLKTTRIRSLSGEQLIFANGDLLKSRIRNYQRMRERRIVFSFGVLYQTTAEQLKHIPGILKNIIEHQEKARFDRAHFLNFGDSSLNFEVVFYVLSPDYLDYMNIQQKINLALVESFEKEKIEFAYPTRTIFVEKFPLQRNGD